MKNKLFTTTALFALLTSAAFADNHTVLSTDINADVNAQTSIGTDGTALDASGNADVNAQVETPSTSTENDMTAQTNALVANSVSAASTSSTNAQVGMTMSGDAVLASNLLGKKVYSSAAEDAEVYGDVNDVVMDQNGNTQWVIVGVGGFLGLGEKEVALSIDQIDWIERDDERIVITNMTKAELEAAAEFDRDALQNDENFSNSLFSWTEDGKMQLEKYKAWDWEHAKLETVASADVSADKLIGARVHAPNSDDIGEVSDVLLTDEGKVTAYIVDVGGFLGLGEKPVALSSTRLHIYQNAEGDLTVRSDFTEEELNNSATYDAEEYKNNPDAFIVM